MLRFDLICNTTIQRATQSVACTAFVERVIILTVSDLCLHKYGVRALPSPALSLHPRWEAWEVEMSRYGRFLHPDSTKGSTVRKRCPPAHARSYLVILPSTFGELCTRYGVLRTPIHIIDLTPPCQSTIIVPSNLRTVHVQSSAPGKA